MGVLEGKRAIVTGAAQGLGLAIAERYVQEGARVVMADINDELLHVEADRLGQAAFTTDVSRKESVISLVTYAAELFGGLDIMVNNAGIVHGASVLDIEEREFDRVMTINVKSVLFGIQAVAPLMISAGNGSIINMSSLASLLAGPDGAAYSISKAAVSQLTNAAAIALAPKGVRVNAIGPGTIATEMARSVYDHETAREAVLSRTPMGRLGTPEEVAGVAVFLAGEDSSYVTGKTIIVDGGRLGLNITMPGSKRAG